MTITFNNDEPRLIKIHSATETKSKEVQFRSIRQCTAFKARWEAEVSRRKNEEFVMICVYGCIGLTKREDSNHFSSKKKKGKGREQAPAAHFEDEPKTSSSKKKGLRKAFNPMEWKISGSSSAASDKKVRALES